MLNYVDYVAGFLVSRDQGNGKLFRIRQHGFDGAYRLAVACFCEYYGYIGKDKTYLLNRKPSRELFTGYLYRKRKKEYKEISLADLKEQLGTGL